MNFTAAGASALLFHGEERASFVRIVLGSAAGGAVMYGGQRLVGTGQPALRLVGLEGVALGASMARNIAEGNGILSRITLPLYPLYVTVLDTQPRIRVRVSVMASAAMIRWLALGRRPDVLESLYSGALVFPAGGRELDCYLRQRGECNVARVGEHQFGAVEYVRHPDTSTRNRIMAHELEHVSQDSRDAILFALPMNDLLAKHSGKFGRALAKFVVLDAFLPLMVTSDVLGPPRFDQACNDLPRFYECEAYALAP